MKNRTAEPTGPEKAASQLPTTAEPAGEKAASQLPTTGQQTKSSSANDMRKMRNQDFKQNLQYIPGPKESNARTVMFEAMDLGQKQQWTNASSMLDRADPTCGEVSSEDAKSCHAVLNSAQGYLKLQETSTVAPQSPRAQELLNSAASSYQNALRYQPDNGPLLNNYSFVLMKVGKTSEAQAALEKAIQVDPGRTALYALRLGELHGQQKQWDLALKAYAKAAAAAPESALPARKTLDIYRNGYPSLSAASKDQFMRTCSVWETTAPELARSGYEFIFLNSDPGVVNREQSLLLWTSLLARRHGLKLDIIQSTADAAQRQPAAIEISKALSDLLSYLRRPWQAPAAESWWMQQTPRRTVLARVSLAWGQENQVTEGPQNAELCWQTGLKILPQGAEHGAVNIPGALQLSLDLRVELVSLYDRQPGIDPQKAKTDQLVGELFSEKMMVIAAGDVAAEQRYHNALGLIFSEQKRWRSGDAANAIYQLTRVLQLAANRYQDGPTQGFYEPLPDVKGLLAQAYWSQPQHAASSAAEKAIETAMAYLDTDDLKSAAKWLDTAHQYGAPEPSLELLGNVLQFRVALAGTSPPGMSAREISSDRQPWLFNFNINIPGGDDFLKRQRFKVYADLAQPALPAAWDPTAAMEAFKLIISGSGTPLIGATDLHRWEKVNGILHASLNAPTSGTRMALPLSFPEGTSAADFAPRRHIPSGDGIVLLTLPGETDPLRIELPPTTLILLRIVTALDPSTLSTSHEFLQLGATGVTVTRNAPMDKIKTVLDKLRSAGLTIRLPSSGPGV
ncbi:MAG TPA: tetratricopeptide repeat protein [Candidatus Angelobacter sp.]